MPRPADPPPPGPRDRRRIERRLRGLGVAVAAACAISLGMTPSALATQRRGATVAQIAQARGVPLPAVRRAALAAAAPMLDEAVRSGDITEDERRALRWRVEDRLAGPIIDATGHWS